jgi:hypothetical protein
MPKKKSTSLALSPQKVAPLVKFIRGERVLLDRDLAQLYGVETRTLKQGVRRNLDRFPDDFMFEVTDEEVDTMVSQNVIPCRTI